MHPPKARKPLSLSLVFAVVLGMAQGLVSPAASALEALKDSELSDVGGEGIAFAFQDYRMWTAGTSYFELTGNTPSTITLPSGSTYTPMRADVRYYGLSLTDGRGNGSGNIAGNSGNGNYTVAGYGTYNFDGSSCTNVTGGATGALGSGGCPIAGDIPWFAPVDNPFVLRVFNYTTNTNKDGTTANVVDYTGTTVNTPVLELLAPTMMDSVRLSTMIELTGTNTAGVRGTCTDTGGSGSDTHCWLKAQFMIYDDSVNDQSGVSTIPSGNAGSVLRILQNTGQAFSSVDNVQSGSNPTVGTSYQDHTFALQGVWNLTGDFRFTLNQSTAGDALDSTTLPVFSQREGLYFLGTHTYLPLGQLSYQSVIFEDDPGHTGNFVIELTLLPDNSTVYNDFYSLPTGTYTGINQGYNTITSAMLSSNYGRTHGFFYIGTNLWAPATYTYDSNGFINGEATCTNLQGVCTSSPFNTTTAAGIAAAATVSNDGVIMASRSTASTFTAYSSRPDQNESDWSGYPPAPAAQTNTNNGSYSLVNLGDVNMSGLLFQHLFIKSCSAGTSTVC